MHPKIHQLFLQGLIPGLYHENFQGFFQRFFFLNYPKIFFRNAFIPEILFGIYSFWGSSVYSQNSAGFLRPKIILKCLPVFSGLSHDFLQEFDPMIFPRFLSVFHQGLSGFYSCFFPGVLPKIWNSKILPGILKIKIILDVLKGYFLACSRHSFRYTGKSSSQHQFHDSFIFFQFIDYPVFKPGIIGVSPEILSNISPRIFSEVPPGIPVLFMGLLSGILPENFNRKISGS